MKDFIKTWATLFLFVSGAVFTTCVGVYLILSFGKLSWLVLEMSDIWFTSRAFLGLSLLMSLLATVAVRMDK